MENQGDNTARKEGGVRESAEIEERAVLPGKDEADGTAEGNAGFAGEPEEEPANVAEEAKEQLSEAIQELKEQVSEATEEVKERLADIADDVRKQAADLPEEVRGKDPGATEWADSRVEAFRNAINTFADRKIIELRDVSIYHSRSLSGGKVKKRDRGDLVLSGVNLVVKPGEMVYLIGKVGSGKSTLLKTLYAEVPLYEGSGEVVGYDLARIRRRDVPRLRRNLGIVFQDYQLLTDRNVYNNLHYVMRATGWKNEREVRSRIREILGLVELADKELKMPFELSGGEQQRLAIARALINSPQVILADEPTGNLDPAATDEIMKLFRNIVGAGCSIVMSTHNISNIQAFPGRTIRFAAGRTEEINIGSILGI